MAAEAAEPTAATGLNANIDRLKQAIVLIPPMRHGGRPVGFDLRVEKQRARRNRKVRRIALPVHELCAEPRLDHCRSIGSRRYPNKVDSRSVSPAFDDH